MSYVLSGNPDRRFSVKAGFAIPVGLHERVISSAYSSTYDTMAKSSGSWIVAPSGASRVRGGGSTFMSEMVGQ